MRTEVEWTAQTLEASTRTRNGAALRIGLGSPNTRRNQGNAVVDEMRQQSLQPACFGSDIGVEECDERRVRGIESALTGYSRPSVALQTNDVDSVALRKRRRRRIVHDDYSAERSTPRKARNACGVGAVAGHHERYLLCNGPSARIR